MNPTTTTHSGRPGWLGGGGSGLLNPGSPSSTQSGSPPLAPLLTHPAARIGCARQACETAHELAGLLRDTLGLAVLADVQEQIARSLDSVAEDGW